MPTEPPVVNAPAEPPTDRSDAVLSGNASRAVISGAAVRGITYGLSMGLLAVAFAFATRALGTARFGDLMVVLSIAAVGQALGDQALQTVAQRILVAAPAEERPAISARLAGMRLVIMPVAIAVMVGFGVAAGYSGELVVGIGIAGAATLLTTLGGAFQTPMSIELRVGTASLVDLVRHLVITAGLLAAVGLSAGVLGYLVGYVTAGVVHLSLAVALVGKRWRHLTLPTRAELWPVLREVSWLALAIAVNSLFLKLLVIVASLRTGRDEVGIFSAAARITEIAAAVPIFMAGVAFPLLTRAAVDGDHDRLANASRQVVEGLLVLMSAGVVVLVVAAEPLIALFAGPKFAAAAPVLQVQAAALLASTITQALLWTVIALRRERALIATNLLGLFALVTFGTALIGPYGARGAAYSAIGGEVVLAAATTAVLIRNVPASGPRASTILKLAGALAAVIGGGLALPIPPLAAAALAVVAFSGLALGLRLVPAEILAQVPGLPGRGAARQAGS